jgi:hypothetical protein
MGTEPTVHPKSAEQEESIQLMKELIAMQKEEIQRLKAGK